MVALTIMSLSVNTVSAGVDKPSKKWNLDYHKYTGGGSAKVQNYIQIIIFTM